MLEKLQKFASDLRLTIREHAWVILPSLIYFVSVFTLLYQLFGAKHVFRASYAQFMGRYLGISLLIMWLIYVIKLIFKERPEYPIRKMYADLKTRFCNTPTLAGAFFIMASISVITPAFSTFKAMIPFIIPYYLDDEFALIDRLLHFGVDPWRLLHPFLGYPPITFVINFCYNLWFTVLYMVWLYFSLDRKTPYLRMRLFFSSLMVWIFLGNGAALLLSSAGPVYYNRVLGLDSGPYDALMTYLHSSDNTIFKVWALNIQQILWDRYLEFNTELGSGISAMPSMHVSMVVLFCLALREKSQNLYRLMLIYTTIIILGSVHLAWHYAVDGYLGGFLTWCLWRLSGKILKLDPIYKEYAAKEQSFVDKI